LSENYGFHLGINDNEYKDVGVKIVKDEKELINTQVKQILGNT
jgi:NAD(P) transhydrogenase subunit alpha